MPEDQTDYEAMIAWKNRHNHITSPVDQYNGLVDFIYAIFIQLYPDFDDNRSRPGVYWMLDKMAEDATYRQKYNELVMQDIRSSEEMAAGFVKAALAGALWMPKTEEEDNDAGK